MIGLNNYPQCLWIMWAVQEFRFAPDHAKWWVSGCWETTDSLVCRSCRRPGYGLRHGWTSKEAACWHIAWQRSSQCPPAHVQTLPQCGVRQEATEGPFPTRLMDEDALFLAEERWAVGLGSAWCCLPSGLALVRNTYMYRVIVSRGSFVWTQH